MCCLKSAETGILRVKLFTVIIQAICKIGSSLLQFRNTICCLSTVFAKTFFSTCFSKMHVWRLYLLSFYLF